MEDNRRLIPMSIKHLDGDNWIISIEGGESYNVKGDIEAIKKACRRIKAKDGEGHGKCRSSKVGTYLSMVSDEDNEAHKINVWKSKVPHSADEFRRLMERSYKDYVRLDGVCDDVEFYIGVYEEKGGSLTKEQLKDLEEKLDILWVNNMYPYTYNEGVKILNACGYKNNFEFMDIKEKKGMKKTPSSRYDAIDPYDNEEDCVELAKLAGIELEIKNKVMTFKGNKFNQQYIFDNATDAMYLNKNGDLILLHQLDVDGKGLEYNMNDELGVKSNYKGMKKITLTKNYLIEGEVVPKGTVVQLKEKLEFLPTDIWNVAKDMDESERFEYVKAELKKIGDDSTDEEIKAFLDKYKKDLNESLKEDNEEYKPYVNVDNLHFGYNTKYGFIEHEFSKNLIIKNNGKDKTFIFGQLPSKEWAYVVTDVLKGEGGLLEYDVSFKKDVVYYAFKDILEDNGIQESLKESVEGLGDMLDMIEETLKSEDKIDPKNFDKILDIASGDDELLNAWVDWCNASDAKFNKKANKFWEVFDKLCKPYAKGKAKGDDKSKDKKDEE